jgi:hypothetical protein
MTVNATPGEGTFEKTLGALAASTPIESGETVM